MAMNRLGDSDLTEVALELFRLGLQLVRHERKLAGGKGTLRIPKLSALAAVAGAGSEKIAVDQLARAEGVREPTISSTLEELIDAELVELENHPTDKRSKLARTTHRGATRLAREKKRLATMLLEADVDAARADQVRAAIETLHQVLRDFRKKEDERRRAHRSRRFPQREES